MIHVNHIELNPKEILLKKGEWYYYVTLVVLPKDATNKRVTWSSTNQNVASVNYFLGYIYAKNKGQTKIYVTAADGSGKTDYITVRVI